MSKARPGQGPRRRIDVMPVEPFLDHPKLMTLPCAAYGILMRLAHHYWASNCEPLPIVDSELRSISRSHPPTWRRWNVVVMAIWEDVKPNIDRYYSYRMNNRRLLQDLGKKGAGVVRLRAVDATERATKPVRTVPKRRNDAVYEPAAAPLAAAGGRSRRMD